MGGKSKTKIYLNNEIPKLGYLDAKNITRFHTHINLKASINKSIKSQEAIEFYTNYYATPLSELPEINIFRREGNIETFNTPHVLVKEGFSNNLFCATYLDYECAFTSTILGFKSENIDILKLITCYLNSRFSTYFLFLTSSTWGIERERVKPNELYLLPYISKQIAINEVVKIYNQIKIDLDKNYPLKANIEQHEAMLDKVFSNGFGFSKNEQIFIDDTIKYTIDLFHKGYKSIAIKPVKQNETIAYAEKLSTELNDILKLSELKVISNIYKTSLYDPLCLVTLQFIDIDINEDVKITKADDEFKKILLALNQYTLKEYSKGIYVQKNLTYFDEDKIYIVKPNQKRFWTQSKAIEDAQNITLEIMSISE